MRAGGRPAADDRCHGASRLAGSCGDTDLAGPGVDRARRARRAGLELEVVAGREALAEDADPEPALVGGEPALDLLAPEAELMKVFREGEPTEAHWKRFAARFAAQLKKTDARQVLRMLALLSHATEIGVGCYCEDESRCHRSVLIRRLEEAGAEVKAQTP